MPEVSGSTDAMPVGRTRLAVAIVSAATIGLELALMRALSLRFWGHFAYMVISVALLGFGASGTAITLLRGRILSRRRAALWAVVLLFAVSIVAAPVLADGVPLNVQFLAWNPRQAVNVLLLELVLFVPFLLAGTVIGITLTDAPERVSGHYAANLVGSGAGALLTVVAMQVMWTGGLVAALALAVVAAAAIVVPCRTRWAGGATVLAGGAVVLSACFGWQPSVSEYKMLSVARSMPGTREIARTEGPLGRIEAIEGPALHHAPGLSLAYTEKLPPHVLLLCDGDVTGSVYDCRAREEWAFMDQTTAALAYHLLDRPSVLIIGAGGGGDIGLALYHLSAQVVALEMNRQVIRMMSGPLRDRGGQVYAAPSVTVLCRDARGYLAEAGQEFGLIQVPLLDAFGASGAGLYATQESFLYTVESFTKMLGRLAPGGVLSVTRWARTPPRDELRAFDLAALALRRKGLEPARHLAMIRSWATVTVLASGTPFSASRSASIRRFCEERGFDVCYLPDVAEAEVNRFHVLDRPYYLEGARALLGAGRSAYISSYLFDIRPVTDDRPYFFHTFRWRSLGVLREQMGGRSPAFLEVGYLMSVAALVQSALLGAVLIVLPLAAVARPLRAAGRTAPVFAYFLLIGVGFMLLEMALLQKLILYLAHPIYSASAVIAAFLVFGGLGSLASRRWKARASAVAAAAGAVVVVIAVGYVFALDGWLALSHGCAMAVRFAVALAAVAPLAFAMGHMFPSVLRQLGARAGPLVPWAWAVNGFASVVATVGAPLLAVAVGFTWVMLAAAVCYALAGVVARWLLRT